MRPIKIVKNYIEHAEGSCLYSSGNTVVLCVATVEEKIPPFIEKKGLSHGWVTAEYAMLPRAGTERSPRAKGGGGVLDHVSGAIDGANSFDLYFTAISNPLVQFDHGFAAFTDPLSGVTVGDNYYYSRPEMAVAGTLTAAGVTEPVIGTGWFDREWDACCFGGYFHSPFIGTQWDWAGFHLSDGSSWSYYDIFTAGDRTAKMSVTSNFLDSPRHGCAQGVLHAGDFQLTHAGSWVSPHSGHDYPTSFRYVVPREGLDVTVTPLVVDQEATAVPTALGFQPWYEGAARVVGTRHGHAVTGDGYMELFGYP